VTGARLAVPVNALLFRSEGLRAVVVDANHRAHSGRLLWAATMALLSKSFKGSDVSDWIVLNPADPSMTGRKFA